MCICLCIHIYIYIYISLSLSIYIYIYTHVRDAQRGSDFMEGQLWPAGARSQAACGERVHGFRWSADSSARAASNVPR